MVERIGNEEGVEFGANVEAAEPILVAQANTGTAAQPTSATPAAAETRVVVELENGNVLRLPDTASVDQPRTNGADLEFVQADGSVIIVPNGAIQGLTIFIGAAEIPPLTVAALLEANGIETAAGPAGAGASARGSGGNFEVPVGGIGDAFALGDLLDPTELAFGANTLEDLYPNNIAPRFATSLFEVRLSEEGLRNGLADSFGNLDTTNATVYSGTLGATDANNDPLTFRFGQPPAGLTSHGGEITWSGVGSSVLIGSANGQPVIIATITGSDGSFTITLLGPVDHANTTSEDEFPLDLPVTVSDGRGLSDSTVIRLIIEDDSPVVNLVRNASGEQSIVVELDETVSRNGEGEGEEQDNDRRNGAGDAEDLGGNKNTDDVEGTLGQVTTAINGGLDALFNLTGGYGADGPGSLTDAFSFVGFPAEGGLQTTLSVTGREGNVTLFLENGTIVGRIGETVVLTIQIVGSAGEQQLQTTLYQPINHGEDGNRFDSEKLLQLVGDAKVQLQYQVTATDYDGDKSTATATIDLITKDGGVVSFDDDGPIVGMTAKEGATIVLDESVGVTGSTQNEPGNAANNDEDVSAANDDIGYAKIEASDLFTLNVDAGSDGEKSREFSLEVKAAASGLFDTATGSEIALTTDGTTVFGKVGDATVFTITVSANGDVTVNQYRAIKHGDINSHDEAKGLGADKISLAVTVTDGDGDTAKASIDLGKLISFEDDGPAVMGTSETRNIYENDINTAWSTGTSPGGINTARDGAAVIKGALVGLVDFGSDGAAAGGGFSFASNWKEYLTGLNLFSKQTALPENGLALEYKISGNTITASEPDTEGRGNTGNKVFTLTLNADGSYEFRLYDELIHKTGEGKNTELRSGDSEFIDGIDFGQIIKASDRDGDSVTLDGKFVIKVVDDIPQAVIKLGRGSVSVDESGDFYDSKSLKDHFKALEQSNAVSVGNDPHVPGDNNGNTRGDGAIDYSISAFAVVYDDSKIGADAPALARTYSLGVFDGEGNAAAKLNSGLKTTDDAGISLSKSGDFILGVVESGADAGKVAFAITILEDGRIAVAQYLSLWHPDKKDGDDAVSLDKILDGSIRAILTVTDSDGDTSSASTSIGGRITFEDDGPSVDYNRQVVLEDDDLNNGIEAGYGDDEAPRNATGTLAHDYGADGPGSTLLTGITLPKWLGFASEPSTDGLSLTIKQYGTEVLRVTLNDATSGKYTVTQLAPISHPMGGNENNVDFTIQYQVKDGDGDTKNGTLSLTVDDDSPDIKIEAVKEGEYLLTTQDAETIDTAYDTASTSFAGAFALKSGGYGADGPGTEKWTYSLGLYVKDGTSSGLTIEGIAVNLFVVGDVVYGSTASKSSNAASNAVFKLTVNADGTVELTQFREIDHVDQGSTSGPYDGQIKQLGNGLIKLVGTLTLTDADGDSDSSTAIIDLGGNVRFADDGPSISIAKSDDAGVTLTTKDALTIGTASDGASASFGSLFTINANHGADGAGTVSALSYSLVITGAAGSNGEVDSGLDSDNKSIYLYNIGDEIVGSTATSQAGVNPANSIFKLSVNSSGEVTLTQFTEIDHANLNTTSGPYDNQLVELASGLVAIKATASITDGDGDKATADAQIDLGGNVRFADDGPSISIGTKADGDITLTTQDKDTRWSPDTSSASFGDLFTVNPNHGADGPGTVSALSYSLVITAVAVASKVDSGLKSDGDTIYLYNVHGEIYGSTAQDNPSDGAVRNSAIFKISVNSSSGNVSLTQYEAIDHADNNDTLAPYDQLAELASGLVAIKAEASITDDDGDSAKGSATIDLGGNIRFADDGPSISVKVRSDASKTLATYDENTIGANSSSSTVAFGQLFEVQSHDYGADGAGNISGWGYALQLSVADGSASGLASNGVAIRLFMIGNTVYGSTATEAGSAIANAVFKIMVSSGGSVTLTQYSEIDHPYNNDTSRPYRDQVIALDNNLVKLVGSVTITDGDGDKAIGTGSVDLGGNIRFADDGPSIDCDNALVVLDDDDLKDGIKNGYGDDDAPRNTRGTLEHNYGADGAGSVLLTGASLPNGFTAVPSEGGRILTIWQGGTPVLKVELDDLTSGKYTVTQLAPINHPKGGYENNVGFTVKYDVKDGDGDIARGELKITVDDDSPVVTVSPLQSNVSTIALNLDETVQADGPRNATHDRSNTAETTDSNGGRDDVGNNNVWNRTPAISTDPASSKAIGSLSTSVGQIASLFTISDNYGADGAGSVSNKLSFNLSDWTVGTNIVVTKVPNTDLAGFSDAARTVYLVQVSPNVIEGRIPGPTNWDKDNFVAFRLTLVNSGDLANAMIVVDQFLPIDHGGSESPSQLDEQINLLLSGKNAALNLVLETTITDKDGDSHIDSANVTLLSKDKGLISFDDDGPQASVTSDSQVDEGKTMTGSWSVDGGLDGLAETSFTFGNSTQKFGSAQTVVFDTNEGTLTVYKNLTWKFVAKAVNADQNLSFTVTAKDGDGDVVSKTQSFTVKNVYAAPTGGDTEAVAFNEANLSEGSNPNADALEETVNLTFTAGSNALTTFKFAVEDADPNSNAGQITWDFPTNGTKLTGSVAGQVVITLTIVGTPTIAAGTQNTVPVKITLGNEFQHYFGDDVATVLSLANIKVQGSDGVTTVEGQVSVSITDDVPTAKSDSFTQSSEDAAVTGNVLEANGNGPDIFGADGRNATAVSLVAGSVKVNNVTVADNVISLNADGSFTYTPAPGQSGNVTFSYTITDGDGDKSTATATITLEADSVPTLSVSDGTVDEKGLANGSGELSDNSAGNDNSETTQGTITIGTGGDQLSKLEINGQNVTAATTANPITVGGMNGVLTITRDGNGDYKWSYTLTKNLTTHNAQGAGDTQPGEAFVVKVTDSDNSTATDTLDISVKDDAPVAVDISAGFVAEDTGSATILGNVKTDAGNRFGADGEAGSNAVTFGSASATLGGNAVVLSDYGTFTPDAVTGAWSFTLDNNSSKTQALNAGDTINVSFNYTLQDGDADTTTKTVSFTIKGANDGPTVSVDPANEPSGGNDVVYEAGLSNGSGVSPTTTLAAGTFKLADADGLADIKSVTIGTTEILIANLGTNNVISGANGTLTITSYNPATGLATYTYELTSRAVDIDGPPETDAFNLTVTDNSNTASDPATITIVIADDAPIAHDVSGDSVTEDSADNSVGGNVGTGYGNTFGADGAAAANAVTFGNATATLGGIPVTLTDYGTFIQNPVTGAWSFTLDNNSSKTQALNAGDTINVSFNYTLQDGDADTTTKTISFTIKGAGDSGTVTVTPNTDASDNSGIVYEKGLTSSGDNSEIETGTFKVTATDGVASVTIGGTNHALTDWEGKTVDTVEGTLTITAVSTAADGKSSVFTYEYVLKAAQTHTQPGNNTEIIDTIGVAVAGIGGSNATGDITIKIVDDVPVVDFTGETSVAENAAGTISGSYLFRPGADGILTGTITVTVGASVFTVTASELANGETINTAAGQLVLSAPAMNGSGTWTFDPSSVFATTTVNIAVSLTDKDGDISTDTHTITVNNVSGPLLTSGAVSGVVEEEHGLPGGVEDQTANPNYDNDTTGNPNVTTNTASGSYAPLVTGGIDGTLAYAFKELTGNPAVQTVANGPLTSGGQPVLFAMDATGNLIGFVNSNSNGGYQAGADVKVFTMTLNPSTGAYTFTLNAPVDHPLNNPAREDSIEINLNGYVTATDVGDSSAGNTSVGLNGSITVIDDVPIANNDTTTLNIVVDDLSVGSIVAAWTNIQMTSGSPNQYDLDGDGSTDEIRWPSGSGSGYGFVDNPSLANLPVSTNETFSLGTFTHYNFPVSGGTLESTTLSVTFTAMINGEVVQVGPILVNFDHTETDNNGSAEQNRDIISISTTTTTVNIEGQNYTLDVRGFVDTNNNIVSTVRTYENQQSNYQLAVRFVSSDSTSVTKTGDVIGSSDLSGADLPLQVTAIVGVTSDTTADSSGNFQVNGTYGTLVINKNGTYTYTLTKDASAIPSGAFESFTYTVKDGDGDPATAPLKINLNKVDSAANPLHGDRVLTNIGGSGADIVISQAALLYNDDAGSTVNGTTSAITDATSVTSGSGNYTFKDNDINGGKFTYHGQNGSLTDSAIVTVDRSQAGSSTLNGTSFGEILIGRDGNDLINGGGGDDYIVANGGNDTIDGGTGADVMIGGAGNDTYVVDNVGDVVTEGAGAGTDTVEASISHTLSSNVENLTLTGGGAINGTGNELDNIITGNSGNNVLNGGGGNDKLVGGAGNDVLSGGEGADKLVGGVGQDTLNGGLGNNTFVLDGNTTDNYDIITDFVSAKDVLNFINFSLANHSGAGGINSAITVTTTGGSNVSGSQNISGSDLVIFNVSANSADTANEINTLLDNQRGTFNGGVFVLAYSDVISNNQVALYYDADANSTGSGAGAVLVAVFTNYTSVTEVGVPNIAADFVSISSADPIILDLGANGYAFSTLGEGAAFDLDADGKKDQLAWNSSSDGILAYDVNGNGTIDDGSELFTPWFNGGNFANGSAALASLDSNGDGVIDANDDAFGKLQIWQDADGDGVSDAGELKSLADHGITSLSASTTAANSSIDGQAIVGEGTFTRADGTTGGYVEVELDIVSGGGEAPVQGETIIGTDDDDFLTGTDGDDIIIGGLGNDTLTGGAGANTFVFSEAGPDNADTITDFVTGEDAIDLGGLLDAALIDTSNVGDYVRVEDTGADALLQVNTTGTGDNWVDVATLTGNGDPGTVIDLKIDDDQYTVTIPTI